RHETRRAARVLSGGRSPRQECLKHLRNALLVDGGTDEVRDLLDPLVRVGDGYAVAGPLDELDVVLAVAERDRLFPRETDVLGDELEPGRLRHVRRRELEEVGQRLRD